MDRTVSHYKLVKMLGAGAAAEVYLADDTSQSRQVALKLLHPHLTKSAEQVRRFEQEAEWISLLNHPNVVAIFEIGQAGGQHFMATEFVDGETLRESILDEMPLRQILEVSIGVAGALAAAHEEWIVHRDIKPENILLANNGQVKVVDFGFAKLTRPSAVVPQALTRPGTVLGTLHYLAPEQLAGWGVDPRADLYSLGVVMYEMVTGFPPFDAVSNRDLAQQILHSEPPPLSASGRRDIPPELELVIQRALQKDSEDRYQSAREMMIELQEIRRGLDS